MPSTDLLMDWTTPTTRPASGMATQVPFTQMQEQPSISTSCNHCSKGWMKTFDATQRTQQSDG